jgi:hypothetical protein
MNLPEFRWPALSGGIELEVDGPHPVGRVGGRDVGSGGVAAALVPPPLRHSQTLFTPKATDVVGLEVSLGDLLERDLF